MSEADGLACSGRDSGWTGIGILTPRVKAGRTSDNITYLEERVEDM